MLNNLSIAYDERADVLYLKLGSVGDTNDREVEPGAHLRYDASSGELVGATFVDFAWYWMPRLAKHYKHDD